jgi:hypothetical protein
MVPPLARRLMPAWMKPSRSAMTRPPLRSPLASAALVDDPRPAARPALRRGRRLYDDGEHPLRAPVTTLFVGHRTGPNARRHARELGLPLGRRWGRSVDADVARAWLEASDRAPPQGRRHGSKRRLFVNTLAKNWAMTGRQIGWLKVHPSPGQKTENMIPYATSGVRPARPRADVVLRERRGGADPRARHGRDGVCLPLALPQVACGGCRTVEPETDTRRRTKRSVNCTPGGRGGRRSRVSAPAGRGLRYSWKGPPIKLPLRALGATPGSGPCTV